MSFQPIENEQYNELGIRQVRKLSYRVRQIKSDKWQMKPTIQHQQHLSKVQQVENERIGL
jgi:hypothetical protein